MSTDLNPEMIVSAEQKKRSRNVGFGYLGLAVITLLVFSRRPGDAGFRLTEGGAALTLPAQQFAWIFGIVFVALAAAQLLRGFGKLSSVVLFLATAVFVLSFLSWATAGESFSLVGMLQDTVSRSVPITLGALGGILCERSGVINIAIEGMLLAGAFTGAVGASLTNLWFGTIIAMLTGVFLAWILAVFSIRYRVDQVIVGFAINFFALGITSFLSFRVLVPNPDYNSLVPVMPLSIPLLSKIPFIGQILFVQTIFVYFSFAAVAVLTWAMYRTRWGLRTRAAGEYPKAAGTLGVDIIKLRYRNLMIAGAVAGIGGAWWPIGTVGRFDQNITGGRGFIALAAVIFGRWHPVGAFSGALVFALAEAVRLKIGNFDTGIPSEFLLMAPYLVTLVVVAGFVGSSRAPKAAGQPYDEQ